MPRLFVAIELPAPVTTALTAIQPRPLAGLRLVRSEQMHLTLHFIGEAEIPVIAAALEVVVSPTFELTIAAVGRFPPRGKATVLWAGITMRDELLALHTALGAALAKVGFRPETRPYAPYAPHVTLARCRPDLPPDVVENFLSQHQGFALPALSVTTFALYSSTITNDVPVYCCERRYPLGSP